MNANTLEQWVLDPLGHVKELVNYFSHPQTVSHGKEYPLNNVFLDFFTKIKSHRQDLVRPLCEKLPGDLLLIGALHDDQDIAECSQEILVGLNGLKTFALLEKSKLSSEDVFGLISLSCANPKLSGHLRKAISVYKLHDPDGNRISSNLKRMSRIKAARLLYFIIPAPETWQELNMCLSEASESDVSTAWERFAYEPPAYTKFSWHIQSLVVRIILLALSFHRRENEMMAWGGFCSENSMTLGHDGKADGFNKESLKMINKLSHDLTRAT